MADMCLFCGTIPNAGEVKCATREAANRCPWMVGVHRGVIVEPTSEQKKE